MSSICSWSGILGLKQAPRLVGYFGWDILKPQSSMQSKMDIKMKFLDTWNIVYSLGLVNWILLGARSISGSMFLLHPSPPQSPVQCSECNPKQQLESKHWRDVLSPWPPLEVSSVLRGTGPWKGPRRGRAEWGGSDPGVGQDRLRPPPPYHILPSRHGSFTWESSWSSP